jgi:hypothetical protein
MRIIVLIIFQVIRVNFSEWGVVVFRPGDE